MNILEIAKKCGFHVGEYRPEEVTIFGYIITDMLEAFAKEISEQSVAEFKSRCELVDKNYVVYSPSTQNWKLKPLYALPKD